MQCDEKKQICLNYAANVPEWQMGLTLEALAALGEVSSTCGKVQKAVGPVKRKNGTIAKTAEEVAEYTQKTYGRVLCWTCAKKQPEDGGLTHA